MVCSSLRSWKTDKFIGIWKRTIKKDQVTLATTYFKSLDKSVIKGVEEAFMKYAHFLGKTC